MLSRFITIVASLLITQLHASWLEEGLNIFESITKQQSGSSVTSAEVTEAFKSALNMSSEYVVERLGSEDGFNKDPLIHIPLPDDYLQAKELLTRFGMGAYADEFELKLNRAAERATPKAKALFIDAISRMRFEDVMEIYNGPDDSATQYFKRVMSESLRREMQPIVDESLMEVGALQAYENFAGQYKNIPFVPDLKGDFSTHVLDKGLEGIFLYMAKEEKAIRQDPVKQTTELLKKVFGNRDR